MHFFYILTIDKAASCGLRHLTSRLTVNPQGLLTSPPDTVITRGWKKTDSIRREKSHWEHIHIAHKSFKNNSDLSQDQVQVRIQDRAPVGEDAHYVPVAYPVSGLGVGHTVVAGVQQSHLLCNCLMEFRSVQIRVVASRAVQVSGQAQSTDHS